MSLPKTDLEKNEKLDRMKHPVAQVYEENHAKKMDDFRRFWVKEPRHTEKHFRPKVKPLS